MSTFDPRFEPPQTPDGPGDWQTNYAAPQQPQGSAACRRAAVWVWVCSGIELLMSTCCTCVGLAMAVVPKEEVLKQLPADAPNRDQIVQMLPKFPTIGLVIVGLGLVLMLPAILMCVLAFWVRSCGRAAAVTCIVLLGIQGLVFSLLLVSMIVVSLRQGIPPDLVGIVIYLGLIVLIGKTVLTLREALKRSDDYADMLGSWHG